MKLPKGNPCDWIRRTARPGETVIDGGANKGEFSTAAAEAVGADGLVIAVEPDPRCADKLRKVTEHFRQVRYVAAALDCHDAGALLTQGQNAEQSSLKPYAVPHSIGSVQVATVLLNDLVRGPVAAVKLDLQGGEPMALLGGSELLERCPQWCVELWPWALNQHESHNLDFLLWLFKSLEFTPHSFADGMPEAPYEQLLAWGSEGYEPHTHCNVIFTR